MTGWITFNLQFIEEMDQFSIAVDISVLKTIKGISNASLKQKMKQYSYDTHASTLAIFSRTVRENLSQAHLKHKLTVNVFILSPVP